MSAAVVILSLISIFDCVHRSTAVKSQIDMVSWGASEMNFGGCNCNCDGKGKVQLMAIQKIVEVPKIKVHDFGKKDVSKTLYMYANGQ